MDNINEHLFLYAQALQEAMKEWTGAHVHHDVSINYSSDLIECVMTATDRHTAVCMGDIKETDISRAWLEKETGGKMSDKINLISRKHRRMFAFDGQLSFIYKTPCPVCWSQEQAELDAIDFIGFVLLGGHHA